MDLVWPHLEQVSDYGTPVLLQAAQLTDGERVLDVGCGGGNQTLALASAVAPQGSVVGIDISQRMIALAQQRVEQSTSSNVALMVGDAQSEELSGPFDVVVSQFGCMFFDTPESAYANLFAALKPGGRIVCVVWQAAERMTWLPNHLLQPFLPDTEAPINPHALSEPAYVEQLFTKAGFVDLTVQPLEVEAEVNGNFIQDAFTLDMVPDEHKAAARELIAKHKEQFRIGKSYHIALPMQVLCARKTTASGSGG